MHSIAVACVLLGSGVMSVGVSAADHPRLLLTADGVSVIRSQLGKAPLFDDTLEVTQREVDAEIASGIDVPIPVDFSGGYTHERHKRNFFVAEKAGALFQILGDEKYARYLRDMLFEYAEMYPTLHAAPPSGVGVTWRRNSRALYRALAATRRTGQAVR